jgi:hypothetical protein
MSDKCIYCGRKGKLSREHYLPRCLGNFSGYEQLKDRICGRCNTGFSKLDEQVCRIGPEALIRERLGVKGYKHHLNQSPFQRGSAGALPLELKGIVQGKGTQIDLYIHRRTMTVRRKRQVTFTTDIGEVVVEVTDDMTEPKHLYKKLLRTGAKTLSGRACLVCAPDEKEWILHLLSCFKKNMIGEPEIAETPEQTVVNVRAGAHPTHLYFRGLAKIGFHYFLKHMTEFHGSEDCFAGIRYFITQGRAEDVDRFTDGRVNYLPVDDVQPKPSPVGYHHHLEAEADCRRLLSRLQFFIGPGFTLPVYTIYLGRSPLLVDYTRRCAHSFIYSDRHRQKGYDGGMAEARPYWA